MIPIKIRHRISHRGLGYTAFSLKDSLSEKAVASWIIATLQCQGVSPPDVEVKIGSGRWTAPMAKHGETNVKPD